VPYASRHVHDATTAVKAVVHRDESGSAVSFGQVRWQVPARQPLLVAGLCHSVEHFFGMIPRACSPALTSSAQPQLPDDRVHRQDQL